MDLAELNRRGSIVHLKSGRDDFMEWERGGSKKNAVNKYQENYFVEIEVSKVKKQFFSIRVLQL